MATVRLESRKDKTISLISSIVISLVSYLIFINSPGTVFIPFEYLFILAIAIGALSYTIQINPKNIISVSRNNQFISFMTLINGKKVEGNIRLSKIKKMQVEIHERHQKYFDSGNFDTSDLWRTLFRCEFEYSGQYISILIEGTTPLYSESILQLIEWNFLVPSDADPIYFLNLNKFSN